MNSDTQTPLLLVLSAPSGGGKTTLCQQLLGLFPNLAKAVTCTTRPPRSGEQAGVDYYFLDAAAFQRHVTAGDFLEYATVYGNRYGNLKSEVAGKLSQGKDVLLTVDVQGAATIRAKAMEDAVLAPALVTIFLTPPSLAVLEERLNRRGTDSDEVRHQRLSMAKQEIGQWRNFDYLILSTSIAEDLGRMQAIIVAEKMRPRRMRSSGLDCL